MSPIEQRLSLLRQKYGKQQSHASDVVRIRFCFMSLIVMYTTIILLLFEKHKTSFMYTAGARHQVVNREKKGKEKRALDWTVKINLE
jgi:hypothetical protein